jgi:hypothetical protein
MQYKVVYRPYDLPTFISIAKLEGDRHGGREAMDFDAILNEHAEHGWKVINSGTILYGTNIVFWALLEKAVDGSVHVES